MSFVINFSNLYPNILVVRVFLIKNNMRGTIVVVFECVSGFYQGLNPGTPSGGQVLG